MKKAVIIIPLAAAAVTAACAPIYRPGMYGAAPYHPAAYGASIPMTAAAPMGRWDNVMLLSGGTALEILTADGQRISATFAGATNTMLRVHSEAGDAEIAAEKVVRVDRWYGGPEGARSVTRDAAKGAAVGAGTIGVLGLLTGVAPPSRTVAAGAIMGAYNFAETGRTLRRTVTVYLSPSVALAGAGDRR